jgi:hypothetical protein
MPEDHANIPRPNARGDRRRSIRMNAGTSRLRSKALPTIGLALMVSAALALQATPATAAASGEWVGTLRVTQTKTESGPHYAGSGPNLDLQVSGSQANPTVDSFAYDGNTEFDYGVFNTCHEHTDRQLVSYVSGGGQFIAGLVDPTSLRVQAGISGWTYDLTQTYTGSPADGCGQSSSTSRIEAGAFASSTLITLIDPDQEAVRGTIVTLDLVGNDPGGAVITSSHIHEEIFYEVHRNCTGFDADGGGVSDCDELDDGTDPSLGTDDLGGGVEECEGPITVDDVIGPDPVLAAGRVFPAFPNDDAICKAVWVPGLDQGFIPQGIHLVGDGTALVSGYHEMGKDDTLRIVRVDLSDGSTVGTPFTLPAGGHGGGITVAGDGKVWVAATNNLWMWPSVAALASGTQPLKLGKPKSESFKVSYFADAADQTHLWIGSFETNELLQFQLSTLNDKVGTNVKLLEADSTATIVTGARTQGGEFHDPNLWTASSYTAKSTNPNARVAKSKCGTLQTGLGTRTRFGFAPGIEEITFDDQGFLWFVSEAGAQPYAPQFFPVIAQADTSVILELHEAPDSKCTTGI